MKSPLFIVLVAVVLVTFGTLAVMNNALPQQRIREPRRPVGKVTCITEFAFSRFLWKNPSSFLGKNLFWKKIADGATRFLTPCPRGVAGWSEVRSSGPRRSTVQ
jgi:hypothetical protein